MAQGYGVDVKEIQTIDFAKRFKTGIRDLCNEKKKLK
jgi:hypothetical protein